MAEKAVTSAFMPVLSVSEYRTNCAFSISFFAIYTEYVSIPEGVVSLVSTFLKECSNQRDMDESSFAAVCFT